MSMPKNIKAMRTHRILAVLYIGLAIIFFFALSADHDASFRIGLPLIIATPGAVHAIVAYGAGRCAPWARVLSMVIAVLLLAGIPLGTLVGIYLLANSSWDTPQSEPTPA